MIGKLFIYLIKFSSSSGELVTVVIVPVGWLRQRHIDGLRYLLAEYGPIRKIYILYSAERQFAEGVLSVRKNAEAVASAFSGLVPEVLSLDTADVKDVSRTFTEILLREGMALTDLLKENVLVDISSTTKQVIIVSTLFANLFGLRVYYVKGKKKMHVKERTQNIFNKLFSPDSETRQKMISILSDSESSIEQRLEKLESLLIQEVAEITYELSAQSPAGTHPLEVIPSAKDTKEFTEDDKLILAKILELGATVDSIAELHRQMKGAIELSTLAYRVSKLVNWGLLQASGKKAKQLELTPVSRGIAQGFLKTAKPLLYTPSQNK